MLLQDSLNPFKTIIYSKFDMTAAEVNRSEPKLKLSTSWPYNYSSIIVFTVFAHFKTSG